MRILFADHVQERRESLRRILLGEGLTCEADDVVGYDTLTSRLAIAQPDLVLIACNGHRDEALAAVRTAYQLTAAPILVASEDVSLDSVRQAMAAGAREYLNLARLREELSEALVKIEAETGPSRRGKLISLFSPSGGVGVSTTAINLAVRLADKTAGEVALVDLKPAPSDLALLLDIAPQHTLDDLASQWERLDRKMLAAAMVEHRSGVHVLAQGGYPADGSAPPATLSREAVRQLATLLKRMYRVAVLDLAHTLAGEQLEAMRQSNFVGLIVRPDVPGLHHARWALDALAAAGIGRDHFRLVLNRYGQSGQVDVAKVEEILGIRVFARIPDDRSLVNRAVNRGVPVSELSSLSRISRSYSSLARSV